VRDGFAEGDEEMKGIVGCDAELQERAKAAADPLRDDKQKGTSRDKDEMAKAKYRGLSTAAAKAPPSVEMT
jgi:hypothetical protein